MNPPTLQRVHYAPAPPPSAAVPHRDSGPTFTKPPCRRETVVVGGARVLGDRHRTRLSLCPPTSPWVHLGNVGHSPSSYTFYISQSTLPRWPAKPSVLLHHHHLKSAAKNTVPASDPPTVSPFSFVSACLSFPRTCMDTRAVTRLRPHHVSLCAGCSFPFSLFLLIARRPL